jgi:transcriptional regulator with XRE-family HTH domain
MMVEAMRARAVIGKSATDKSLASEAAAGALGRQLRAVRQQRALSMQALADQAGISRAWLGEIERGAASPSVDVVRRLANTLGVAVSSLLDGRAAQLLVGPQESTRQIQLVRAANRPILRFPSQPFSWSVITPLRGELQMMIAELEPTESAMELMEHGGQESVFVLEGQLEVSVAAESFVLEQGDCITFPAGLPHGFMNRGPRPARMLNATSPPSIGERRHIV